MGPGTKGTCTSIVSLVVGIPINSGPVRPAVMVYFSVRMPRHAKERHPVAAVASCAVPILLNVVSASWRGKLKPNGVKKTSSRTVQLGGRKFEVKLLYT